MAEAIYRSLTAENSIEAASRGLVVLFEEPLNAKAGLVAQNHSLALEEHHSVALTHEELTPGTLLLTMSEKQKQTILSDYPEAKMVFTLNEFVGEGTEVLDPYGEGLLEYEELYTMLVRMVKKAIVRLRSVEQDIEEDTI